MARLWDKGDALDRIVLEFTAGEDHLLDARLVPHDVEASIAHAAMLHEVGHLSSGDFAAIRTGLTNLARDHAAGLWEIALEEEDVHTALESRLVERIGEAGERLHLGRSRNDQVLAALRLYLKAEIGSLAAEARAAAAALDDLAARHADLPLPGYTHMQRAMPSSVPLWAGGFATELRDDAEGLEAVRRRADKNPLGSAAGYGTPGLELDRESTRTHLGFATTHSPVTAVQLSRGKAEAQLLFEIALLTQDLGRLAADLVLFNMQELAYVALPTELTTGSSIMPQKRNPDLFELVRGRTATALAALQEVLAVCAKLPSGYHRDLQLIKAPLFRGIDLAHLCTRIMIHALEGLRFVPENLHLAPELHATEKAYRLVQDQGLSFREAYRRVGEDYRGRG